MLLFGSPQASSFIKHNLVVLRGWMCCSYLKNCRLLGEPALRLRWIEVLLDLERLWALGGGIDGSTATARSWN